MGEQEILIRQSPRKFLRVLPLAFAMFAASAILLWVSARSANLLGVLGGGLAVTFFGPAFLILLHASIQPSHLRITAEGIRCRFYSLSLAIPWENIREVSGGAGWPALIFHDCDAVARSATFHGFPPLGWLLQIPTKAVGLLLRRPVANIYPLTRGQLLGAFRANEKMFGFHYGMPTSLLERSTEEILSALRRYKDGKGWA
jgi:hypothetical protein